MALRYSLGGLLGFGALNAFGGGYSGLTGAEGVPTDWLKGSPFTDYYVPSIILLLVVGGLISVGGYCCVREAVIFRPTAIMAGLVVLSWPAVQVVSRIVSPTATGPWDTM